MSPTFLVNILRDENPIVATRALRSPAISNDTSVNVAIQTPIIIGTIDKYTCEIKRKKGGTTIQTWIHQ